MWGELYPSSFWITGVTEIFSAASADDNDDVTFVSGIVAIDALAVADLLVV